ncbi:magnesium chelatase subunit D [uncultured Enterovirga sp.]|uniref:magnesium chelatase subunit D n=1 Tax=uncultured Enterovirga sp. TaxID=2026352 RepID=UPI0035CB98A8
MTQDAAPFAEAERPGAAAWSDACLAAELLAVDPAGLGGVWLRARIGPPRDRWLALLRNALPASCPVTRVPLHAGDERLLGGLDLAATLRSGRPVAERGLLAATDGGVVLLPSAERLAAGMAARLTGVLDTGEVTAERDGLALRSSARIGLVALDEGIEADERVPAALADRLAFHVDLTDVQPVDARPALSARDIEEARGRLSATSVPDDALEALCAAAWAFGVESLRAPAFAVRAARAAAAVAGRSEAAPEDVALAARLVLSSRATRLPAPPDEAASPPPESEPPPDAQPEPAGESEPDDADSPPDAPALDDLVLAATAAAIPAGLLEQLRSGPAGRARTPGAGGSGALQRDRRRGRPAGTLRGEPTRGARLNLVETLRAAAPWQPLRRDAGSDTRLSIRRDDLRITRLKRRTETTTVFVVDASGSAAFQRLAEAKGAVELLLADCYVRRDRVALISFRGAAAELLLPPTRSLTRAKRSLAALPGGGGTPLAAAIDDAATLADVIAQGGGSAVLVFLTDGRANVARDGAGGREQASADATAAAQRLRTGRATVLFIDTSPRPHPPAAAIAAAMGARYLPLPAADATTLSGIVRNELAAAAPGGAGR